MCCGTKLSRNMKCSVRLRGWTRGSLFHKTCPDAFNLSFVSGSSPCPFVNSSWNALISSSLRLLLTRRTSRNSTTCRPATLPLLARTLPRVAISGLLTETSSSKSPTQTKLRSDCTSSIVVSWAIIPLFSRISSKSRLPMDHRRSKASPWSNCTTTRPLWTNFSERSTTHFRE